jgi:hypothetical protein
VVVVVVVLCVMATSLVVRSRLVVEVSTLALTGSRPASGEHPNVMQA